jgi:hypothetical protein
VPGCDPRQAGAGNATPRQREEAAEATWQNFLYMREEGLDPIPVFHYGEPWRFLERMLDYGSGYIGIGGLVAVSGNLRRLWLDDLFMRITNEKGEALVKTHGFGMTSIPLIFRYPWFSVDSTTWIKATMSGAVYLPAMRDGEFVFDEVPMTVSVSDRNTQAKGAAMGPSMRALLDRWLLECGKSYEEVASHYYHRAVCNVLFFKRVSEEKASKPFQRSAVRRVALI